MKVNEIFYSIQGEGAHTGTPAVFVRFSGCNLRCSFCDTEHQKGMPMTEQEIINAVLQYPARLVVFTGGEPTLQLSKNIVDALHDANRIVAIETNGTRPIHAKVDWITLSPKFEFTYDAELALLTCNELKVVWTGTNDLSRYNNIVADRYYLQPCDTGDAVANAEIINSLVKYIKQNPKWQISLQTQKILKVR